MRTGCPSPVSILRKPTMCGIVVHVRRPCQSQQHVDVKQTNRHSLSGRRTGIEKVPSGDKIFRVERRSDIVGTKRRMSGTKRRSRGTKRRLRVRYREDTESIALAQQRARLSTLAGQPGKSLADRYAPGLRQRFGQVENIRFHVECCAHLDSMMSRVLIDVKAGRGFRCRLPVRGGILATAIIAEAISAGNR